MTQIPILENLLAKDIEHYNQTPKGKDFWIIPKDLILKARNGRDVGLPTTFNLPNKILDQLTYEGNLINGDYLGPVWTDDKGEIYVTKSNGDVLVSKWENHLKLIDKVKTNNEQSILMLTPPRFNLVNYGIPKNFPKSFYDKATLKIIKSLF